MTVPVDVVVAVRRTVVAGVLAMTLAAVGCGDERPTLVGSESSPPTSADQRMEPAQTSTTRAISECVGSCVFVGWSDFVHRSVGAVVGTVESVSAPRWNQESGAQWDGNQENHPGNPLAGELQYRDAILRLEEVVFRDPGETFVVGDKITVRLIGDDTPTGYELDRGFYINEIDGPVVVGSRVLWVLDREEFHWKERVEYPLGLARFLGNWRIDGNTAVNRLPERTAPLDALIAAIKREASAPHRPGDPRGTKNPLE